MKSYTDLEQSRKLAEFLPLESADMRYHTISHYNPYPCDEMVYTVEFGKASGIDIPCLSLAALLNVLPFPVLYMEMIGGMILWSCECHFMETDEMIKIEHYDNPVDACYEMILKLHEQKIL